VALVVSRARRHLTPGACGVYGEPVSDDAAPSAGSPTGGRGYDPEVVARNAMSKDPGLDAGLALRLAREAEEILRSTPGADAPDIARQLFAGSPETGATPANCVATAAVDHVRGV
jgi:hypothetical protein